jgi:hypothetical protein
VPSICRAEHGLLPDVGVQEEIGIWQEERYAIESSQGLIGGVQALLQLG